MVPIQQNLIYPVNIAPFGVMRPHTYSKKREKSLHKLCKLRKSTCQILNLVLQKKYAEKMSFL